MKWYTQAGNINTNLKVKIYFTLPELSATKIVTWNCQVYDSTKRRYYMILCRDILTQLGLNIKLSEHVIKKGDGTLTGSLAPIVDLSMYEFRKLNEGKITPKESFMKSYAEEINELEQVHTSTKRLRTVFDAE